VVEQCRASLPATSRWRAVLRTLSAITLGETRRRLGGGTASGRAVARIKGGDRSELFPPRAGDNAVRGRAFAARVTAMLGHGGIVVFDTTGRPWPKQARFSMEFCALESCGKGNACSDNRLDPRRSVRKTIASIAAMPAVEPDGPGRTLHT